MNEQQNEPRAKRAYGEGRVFYRKDRGCWFVAYCKNGKEIRERAGTDEVAARRMLQKKLREKERETFIGPEERRATVGQLLDAPTMPTGMPANQGQRLPGGLAEPFEIGTRGERLGHETPSFPGARCPRNGQKGGEL